MARLRRAGFIETAKDRWNAEVEGALRVVQNLDWLTLAADVEAAVGRLWGAVRERARSGNGNEGGARGGS